MSKSVCIYLLSVITLLVSACKTATPTVALEATYSIQAAIQSTNPYPIQNPTASVRNNSYPGPTSSSEAIAIDQTQEYFVTGLDIPTPTVGKSNIFGQLIIRDAFGQPFLATLYLASIDSINNSDQPPFISFSQESAPLAIQDINTGRFLFTNVEPGQYAIIIWTPYSNNPLVDNNGNPIIIKAEENMTLDLGTINMP